MITGLLLLASYYLIGTIVTYFYIWAEEKIYLDANDRWKYEDKIPFILCFWPCLGLVLCTVFPLTLLFRGIDKVLTIMEGKE